MPKLYQTNLLPVTKIDYEDVLIDGGEYGTLHLREAADDLQIGDEVEAFIYPDASGKIVATMATSYAQIGDCAYLKVVSTGNHGAFLDWGLPKDLLLPYSEQDYPVREGEYCVVYIHLDPSDRPVASTAFHDYLDEYPDNLRAGEAVNLMIAAETNLGFKAIINKTQLGLIYHDELAQPLQLGAHMKGWVRAVRDDGKIDLNINALDKKTRNELEERILEELKLECGRLELSDTSSPEDVYHIFQVSKKNFKRALGSLYKQRLIKISPDFIELTEQ